jgi:uncharacterized cupredoxin-like copper-binding protein
MVLPGPSSAVVASSDGRVTSLGPLRSTHSPDTSRSGDFDLRGVRAGCALAAGDVLPGRGHGHGGTVQHEERWVAIVDRHHRMSAAGLAALTAVIAMGALGGCSGESGGQTGAMNASNRPRPQIYGRGALPQEATRVVEIRMDDGLRFDPAAVTVRRGEIVTFHVINSGKVLHELTMGGQDAQDLHEAQMAEMSMTGGSGDPTMDMTGMDHSRMPSTPEHKKYMQRLAEQIASLDRTAAANLSVHVPSGQIRDLTWAFTGNKAPVYGCHVPQHWAGGMRGTVVLTPQ